MRYSMPRKTNKDLRKKPRKRSGYKDTPEYKVRRERIMRQILDEYNEVSNQVMPKLKPTKK